MIWEKTSVPLLLGSMCSAERTVAYQCLKKGRGRWRTLKKLEDPQISLNIQVEGAEVEKFPCLIYGQAYETSVDVIHPKLLQKMLGSRGGSTGGPSPTQIESGPTQSDFREQPEVKVSLYLLLFWIYKRFKISG